MQLVTNEYQGDELGTRTEQAIRVLEFLNVKAVRKYRPTPVNLKFIEGRLKQGYTVEECKQVIAMKVREWKGTDMDDFLRPATLFNDTKFNQYAGKLL